MKLMQKVLIAAMATIPLTQALEFPYMSKRFRSESLAEEEREVKKRKIEGVETAMMPPFAYEELPPELQTLVWQNILQTSLEGCWTREDFEKLRGSVTGYVSIASKENEIFWRVFKSIASGSNPRLRYRAEILRLVALDKNSTDIERFVSILGDYDKINAEINAKGRTLLMLAAKKGYTQMAGALLELGADLTKANETDSQRTALHYAALAGSLDVVRLFKAHADRHDLKIDVRDGRNDSPFTLAAPNGKPEVACWLILNGFDFISDWQVYHNSEVMALQVAIDANQIKVLEFLIASGFNIASVCAAGDPADVFYAAIEKGRREIVELLVKTALDQKINLDVENDEDESPVMVAFKSGQWKLASWLLEQGFRFPMWQSETADQEAALMLAAIKGDLDEVRTLVAAGVNIGAENPRDREMIPLLYAAEAGHTEIVKFFIDEQGQEDIVNKEGDNIVSLSYLNGHQDLALLLVKGGYNGDSYPESICRFDNASSLLDVAVTRLDIEFVKALLEQGVEISEDGFGLIGLALAYAHDVESLFGMIELLIEHGAQTEMSSRDYTCCHFRKLDVDVNTLMVAISAFNKHKEKCLPFIKLLIDNGANINFDNGRTTPLIAAIRGRNGALVSLLLSYKVFINYSDVLEAQRTGDAEIIGMIDRYWQNKG